MKIAFNPSTVAALITPPNNKDITFDLRGRNIFARGVKFCGTDTNTWRDIKINNVSIGSNILDLRNGSNTTLTNTNGVVTINSTWRPVVDNLTSDSTTSSLSANLGRILKALIDGKSNSGHTHDDRYLKLTGGTMTGNIILSPNTAIIKSLRSTSNYDSVVRWSVDGETKKYGREVGLHNDGGSDSTGSIAIIPYKTDTAPWSGTVGLFIAKNVLKLDNKPIAFKSDIPTSVKNPYSLTLLANGTTLATYDGSVSKIVNLTYDNVGAAAKNHTHNSLEPWASYITGDSHATALKSIFDKNKTSIPRNKFISIFSSTYGNGSYYMGYFLNGYENNPYGGFFVAHYDTAYYVGIANGTFSLHRLVYSTDIPNSLKNPHALTISLNGTSQGPYDGSAAKNINITPGSIGAATSGHNHDDRYLKLTGGIMQLGEGLKFHADENYFGTYADARIISLLDDNGKICDGGLIIDERATLDGKEYVTELLRIRDSEFKWKGSNILHSGNSYINGSTITINGSSLNVIDLKVTLSFVASGYTDFRAVLITAETSSSSAGYTPSTVTGKTFITNALQLSPQAGNLYLKGSAAIGTTNFNYKLNVNGDIGLLNTGSIRDLTIGGGIYWNPYVESTTDSSDAASITLVRLGVAGGTTLVLSLMNDANDTILFQTNGSAKLYHNSYPILTSLNTFVNNNKGYIYGNEITLVNNSDTVDGYHVTAINNKPWGTIPAINLNGYMDIGKHLEFHYDNTTGSDYSTVLMCLGNYSNVVNLPSESGTLALTSLVLTWRSLIIDMRNYDESYWHPVTVPLPYTGYNKIKVSVLLNIYDKPSWATHNAGFTCNMEIWATASGWGTTSAETICLNYTYAYCNSNPCGWMLLGYQSLGVLFLRGGSRYRVYTDFNATFTPHDKTYTWTDREYTLSTGGPYTSCPGLNFNKNRIYANLNGTAENADKLDNYHASDLLTTLSNTNNGVSITVGGTTKSISNISVNYANSAGNADTATNAYHLRINSANTWSTWYWSGLSGQPSWLWGSNDGTNMYVWNPSNFRVAYASSAGNADTLDGIDSTKFLRQVVVPNNTENDFNTFSNMTLTGRVDPTTGASLKNAPWSGSGPAGGYGVLTYLFNGWDYGTQMAWEYGSNRIYIRNRHWGGSGVGTVWRTSWDTLALTSDNVASATKLQTSRLLWGQSFDGTRDISGSIRGTYFHIEDRASNPYFKFIDSSNQIGYFQLLPQNKGVAIGSTESKSLIVNPSGNVGIGTTNPSYKLSVGGDIGTGGNIYISHNTNNNMNYNTSNPRIVFSENGNLAVGLVYTDYDSYRASKGLKVMDVDNNDTSNVWLEVLGYNYSSGYVKNGSNSSYVLLGDGGHKLESALNVSNADLLDGQHGSRYTRALGSPNHITINVGGDANTYYPVVISSVSDYYPMLFVNISRVYNETAPNTWNTSTHKGGLTLTLLWNGSRYWDGNSSGYACYCVYKNESYSTMVGGLGNATGGKVVWLRGGGATYHIHSMNGTSTSVTVYTSTYTDVANRSFSPRTTPEVISVRWPGMAQGADYATSASNADTATKVIVNLNTTNDANYPLVWSNLNNSNNATENQLYKSWSDLYYNPKNKRLTVGGSIYAAHFYESSDKTLKKNIKSILSSTNIPKIREFDWKDTGEHSYGFIALELEELGYGCLVNESDGKKTVNYTATLALTVAKLLNLINIQNKKISNLTKELKALKYGRKKNS